jgi:hypothetical protein
MEYLGRHRPRLAQRINGDSEDILDLALHQFEVFLGVLPIGQLPCEEFDSFVDPLGELGLYVIDRIEFEAFLYFLLELL